MTKEKLTETTVKLALVAAMIAMAMPDSVLAGTDINDTITDVSHKELIVLPYILSVVCYIGGAFMLVSGALKLKAHAENPSEKLAPGVARLVTGAVITSVPALTSVLQSSTTLGVSPAEWHGFEGLNFQ